MTDATKNAIERVREWAECKTQLVAIADVIATLAELDRLTKPIEAGEIAEVINTLNLMTTDHTKWEENRHRIARFIDRLARENERLAEALRKISNGGVPRPVGKQYLPDRPSKNDKCTHDRWMYADCDECTAEFADATLSPKAGTE